MATEREATTTDEPATRKPSAAPRCERIPAAAPRPVRVERQPDAGRRGPGARRVLLALAAAAVLFGAVVTAADKIDSGERAATAALRTEVLVARATTAVDGYRYAVEAEPTLGLGLAALAAEGRWQGFEPAAKGSAARLLASVADRSPLGGALVRLNRQLSAVVDRERRLELTGHLAAARRLDSTAVTPLAGRLFGLLAVDEARLARQARAAEASSVHAIALAVGIRAAGLVVLAVLLEAARRRRARRRAEAEALRRANERFAALVTHGTDLFAVVSVDGMIRMETRQGTASLGYDAGALAGTPVEAIVHADDRVLFSLLCERGGDERADVRLREASGSYRSFELAATRLLDHPEIRGIVLHARDVTHHRLLERELHHQAFHDALTGLPNRALFTDRLEHALARRHQRGTVAVCLVDLDDFKAINDGLGHRTGDEVLVEVGRRLARSARPGDTVARFGADTFLVLLDDPGCAEAADEVAARLLGALSAPIRAGAGAFAVRASVGVAVPSADGISPDELVRNAEVAMYEAKAAGKGRVAVYRAGMQAAVRDRLAAVSELEAALEAGDQLEVHFQPIVRLATGEAVGVEALVRWRHPTRGLVPPGEFIPVAEGAGLVVDLGRVVLRQATAQVARWLARHPSLGALGLSVNASPRQLAEPGFVADVAEALADSGLDPAQLALEITESVFVGNDEAVLERLSALKALGVRLAIDDFGTGFASFAYLKRLPVDTLKVDLSFTADLLRTGRDRAVAEAVVQMGATLGLETIAEGVEDRRQLRRLKALSCEYAQGYLFARPLPASDCEALLAGRRGLVGTA